ncbi:MAG TPA: hypothetical protein VFK86_02055 [Bauldia sp.]|nr:hypothetical protein [Bauldia sp.]
MKRILLLYYSQSGEADRTAAVFREELEAAGHLVITARLRPEPDYPYPWRSIRRFFDVMPETQLGRPPSVSLPELGPSPSFDLVILVVPIWFLSPAPPVQGFFRMAEAAALRGAPVLTVTVSRAMWQQGSETLKRLLAAAGARHIDNVVVTHRGSPVATLISTPLALLSGKQGRFMGIFPESGVAEADRQRVRRLARLAATRLNSRDAVSGSLLAGEPAVRVRRWLIGPELLGWYCFHGWARLIDGLGRLGATPRAIGVWGFALFLPILILVGLALTLIGTPILYVLAKPWVERTAARLAAPTGEAAAIRA